MTAQQRDDPSNEWPPGGQGEGPADDGAAAVRVDKDTVSVLLPLPLADSYDYRVPADMALAPGDFVRVPLGRRVVAGVVWGPARGDVDPGKLRDIEAVLPAPSMSAAMRRFIAWVSAYTLTPPGAVLRMAMSVPAALESPRMETVYRLAPSGAAAALDGVKLTAARRRVLEFLRAAPALPLVDVARQAGVGTSVVKALVAAGLVEAAERPRPRPGAAWPTVAGPMLSAAQAAAAAELADKVRAQCFSTTLLDGVPGAGKTEVYFEAVAAALAQGRQALVLLPEIALSTQWLERFARRFGTRPTEWHSDLTGVERRQAWRDVAEKRAAVVVGARSALFLPFADLGLVVVDEEHDGAFKQEDGALYNARDMAVVRARLGDVPIVLASATPSLETVANVRAGRYGVLHLPDRHGGAPLPRVDVVDLRRQPPPRGRWLAPPVVEAVHDTLARGEQALLFLNRRGYAPLTLCRTCGHRLQCPNCSAWLVEHRFRGRLICHHCGYGAPLPPVCPVCEARDSFVPCGPGVERLAEEALALFPGKRTEIFASDTVGTRRAAQAMVERIAAGEVDLVIGTQMAAKGYHFPLLTLVAVIDADLGLAGGDLRAAERTFQLLYQVAGRAGREDRPGRVLLQTHMPEHPVIQALAGGDRERFVAAEMAARESAGWPPFGRLAALIVSGTDEQATDAAAQALARAAPAMDGVKVLGPAPAPLSLLRGRFRRRLLLRSLRGMRVQDVLADWLAQVDIPSSVRVQVDIDPYSFM
jgi:primosomal protein N' (replication factor Y)